MYVKSGKNAPIIEYCDCTSILNIEWYVIAIVRSANVPTANSLRFLRINDIPKPTSNVHIPCISPVPKLWNMY